MSYRKLATHPLHAELRKTLLRTAAGALGAVTPLMALANPSGGQVVAGAATIGNAGANGTVIHQSSQNAVINWQQFNVGANQYVQFVQPNSSSVVLNRVIGGNASSVFGDIRANGQVFLVNPNGVYFAPGSSIDVQGMVASTLDISNSDFMSGNYQFSKDPGAPDASVVNQGIIHTANGGYVVLAGDYVMNQGRIDTQMGSVYLAANNAATLTLEGHQLISYVVDSATLSRLAGVNNTGEITAVGGTVVMTADVANALTATAVNNTGLITAHSVREHGGEIVLEAEGGGIYNSGKLDASGVGFGVTGGTVILHGTGKTELTPNSQIDTAGDHAQGGLIDVSGHGLNLRGFLTAGKGGTLLLDPLFLQIVNGNSSVFSASTNHVGIDLINQQLGLGVNVMLSASESITNHAAGHLIFPSNGTGASNGGTGALTLHVNDGTINISGLDIAIKGALDIYAANSGGTIYMGGATAKSITLHAGKIVAQGALSASNGGISITGRDSRGLANLAISGDVHATGAFLASFSNEGGVPVGTLAMQKVTAGSIKIVGENISTGNLKATTGSLSVTATGPSHNGGSLLVAGTVAASNGSVRLFDQGGKGISVTGNITAAQDVTISASSSGGFHTSLKTGNITGDAVTLRYYGGGASAGTTVKVGNVDSQREMSFSINDTSNAGSLVVKAGTLTNHKGSHSNGQGIWVGLSGANPHFQTAGISNLAKSGGSCECGAGDISVRLDTTNGSHALLQVTGTGVIKSSHGSVSLGSSDDSIGSIAVHDVSGHNVVMQGRNITFGNVTAAGSVVITDHTTASGAAITATPGTTIKARFIDVDLRASYGGAITLANMTASSGAGSAGIQVTAHSPNRSNSITVNGAITVNGKGGNNGFSSAMPHGGAPVGAYLRMSASGSVSPGLHHTIKVNGAINVTGHAGHFNVNHGVGSCECGTINASGVGGEGLVSIFASGSHGSAQLLGVTTVKGTDAELQVHADTIKTGAIVLNGSGHTLALNVNINDSHTNASLASNNNMGRANVSLGGTGSASATAITTGNISVTGKGSATVALEGLAIVAGNVAVTATAASGGRVIRGSRHGNIQHFGVGSDMPGFFGIEMSGGSFKAGRAGVFMGASFGTHSSPGQPANSVKVGNVSVTGVGEADIAIAGHTIQAGSLSATAAPGKMKGTFGSSNEAGAYHQTFTINGGEANVQLDTGYGSGTKINVTGGITANGPVGGVNLFGSAVKVSKGISVTGHVQQATVSASGTAGPGYTQFFKGQGPITGVTIGGNSTAASINVGGNVVVKGPGIIGVAITGEKVTLGGISASASVAEGYTIKNTITGINDTFTAGSVALLVFQESASGAVTGPATVTGGVTLAAPHGSVALPAELNIGGQLKITAGTITTNTTGIIKHIDEISQNTGGHSSSGPNLLSSGALPLRLTAAGMSMIATAGSIDLTGAILKSAGVVALDAKTNIILSGVSINVGSFVADAGGTIHNGGGLGSINAKAIGLRAGKDINLSSTDLSVGSGAVPLDSATLNGNAALKQIVTADPTFAATLAGDPQLNFGLGNGALGPYSSAPDAAFVASGNVILGDLSMTGNYLYLQGLTLSILGKLSTPQSMLVQVAPASLTGTTDMEGQGASGANLNLDASSFLSLFPDGITLVLGTSGQSGSVTLGNDGSFDIGSDNLVVDTSGSITSLSNVISTGLVSSLESLIANAVVPPTTSEIDPNSTNNNNAAGDKKHQGQYDPNGEGGGGGGTISQDPGTSSVCH